MKVLIIAFASGSLPLFFHLYQLWLQVKDRWRLNSQILNFLHRHFWLAKEFLYSTELSWACRDVKVVFCALARCIRNGVSACLCTLFPFHLRRWLDGLQGVTCLRSCWNRPGHCIWLVCSVCCLPLVSRIPSRSRPWSIPLQPSRSCFPWLWSWHEHLVQLIRHKVMRWVLLVYCLLEVGLG